MLFIYPQGVQVFWDELGEEYVPNGDIILMVETIG